MGNRLRKENTWRKLKRSRLRKHFGVKRQFAHVKRERGKSKKWDTEACLTCMPGWTVRRKGMIHTASIMPTDEKDVWQVGV